jgi:hypothetical protein
VVLPVQTRFPKGFCSQAISCAGSIASFLLFHPCKHIYPVYCRKADEVHAVTRLTSIFTAHISKLQKYQWHFYRKFYDCCL